MNSTNTLGRKSLGYMRRARRNVPGIPPNQHISILTLFLVSLDSLSDRRYFEAVHGQRWLHPPSRPNLGCGRTGCDGKFKTEESLMKTKYINFSGAKLALALLAVLAWTGLTWAQGEGVNFCNWSQSAEDHSCGSAGCESVTFTAPYTASDYTLLCDIRGTCGDRTSCHVTATLYRESDGATMGTCDNVNEDPPSCELSGPQSHPTLQQGVQYKLVVCFEGCYEPCAECSNCYAHGQICHS